MYTFLLECPACGTRFPVARPAGGEGLFARSLGISSDCKIHLECISCRHAIEVDAPSGNSREAPHWGLSNANSRPEEKGRPDKFLDHVDNLLDHLRRMRGDG